MYPTRLSSGNYRKPQIILRKFRFRISIRVLAIWNNLVGSPEKEIQSFSFKKYDKKLVIFDNEVSFVFKKLTEASTDGYKVL